jgi:hypothetical protein
VNFKICEVNDGKNGEATYKNYNSRRTKPSVVDAFVEVTEAFEQEVSIKKTEVMAINVQEHANSFSIFIKGKKLNVVHEFKYVGITETETAKLDREVFVFSAWQELIAN